MTVELFNFWYFFFIILTGVSIFVTYKLLKNKSERTKTIVLLSILFFNLALHFLKVLFPPYNTNPDQAIRDIGFINVCATSVLFFPFIFASRSKTAKDYMVFLGLISGFLALLYPTEALNESIQSFDLWRFYICHYIIFAVPLLTVLLGLHKLDIKRIWKIPLCVSAMLLFIICNQILQSELGIISLRCQDIVKINFHNPSLVWGPTDGVAVIFSWLTPDFMKTVPWGEFAGEAKYWPFFWMLPSIVLYFTLLPLVICFIVDFKGTVASFAAFFHKIKRVFVKANHKGNGDTL